MVKQITIEIPERLERRLTRYYDRLPEVLERGLDDIEVDPTGQLDNIEEIVELLASQPTPEQILAIKPSPKLQARVSELLTNSKAGTLSHQEETELDRYLFVEHMARLAKARAYEQLGSAS
jgi:hypothetical protein